MARSLASAALLLLSCAPAAYGQFPPTPEGLTVLKSKFHENVTITFKEPQICETTTGVKSYSGWVYIPPGTLDDGTGEAQDYPINTFFWFFEARKAPENAPLAIWLNGGPGGSSTMGLLEELGPCFVGPDSKTTVLNPWSWNNEVNLLFLDQPTQVGLSYDVPTNATVQLSTEEDDDRDFLVVPNNFTDGVPATNNTFRVGTFPSQDPSHTANSTLTAAHALWHFAQTWFFEFPFYKPADDRISLWAESYGGHYGPGFFRFFQQQNEKIANGSSPEKGAKYLHLDTLGIVNGLVDIVIQGETWITFPYNNTYGIQAFNQSFYEDLLDGWNRPGGCRERVVACQEALKEHDPVYINRGGKNITEICGEVFDKCIIPPIREYQTKEGARGWYDISHPANDPFPAPHMHGFLAEESTLAALGSPVNFSSHGQAVGQGFTATFDWFHGGFLESIASLLDGGVKVHMMYGDRDYACNWVGGERASLAIPYSRQGDFAKAGYQPLLTPDGVSGMTRQFGNFSFTRVFQAGHEVPSYQPAAAYEIFMRATFNRDIATGLIPVTDELFTIGPHDTWAIKSIPPKMPSPRCYVLKPGTCTSEAWETVKNGTAVVKDWFVVEGAEDTAFLSAGEEATQQVIDEL